MTALRITFKNTSAPGGTALTPLFVGFHDNSFDLYNLGQAASPGLEALAEDGNNGIVADEVTAADSDAQTTNVVGDRGPVAAGETASTIIDVNGASNGFASFGSMILPSNDAFIGTANAVQVFDAAGNFTGESTTVFTGASVRDAGTEENTEQDAAFINQTGPNTGVTEGGVVTNHPGFNGSAGNPGGTQTILGGTNAFGELIDPVAADFTLPGAQIAEVHINTVVETTGTSGRDIFFGGKDDDLVDAGDGNDIIVTRDGWDVVDAGDGRDIVSTGNGDDQISGGAGNDILYAGYGDDRVDGGTGNDYLSGGRGDDGLSGGAGNDKIRAGTGDDIVEGGDGRDLLAGNRGNDSLDGGAGNDRAFGGSGNDSLSGGSGRDYLIAGNGNDIIEGGTGNDYLSGGRGNDTFVFTGGDGVDAVRDFGNGSGNSARYRGDDVLSLDVDGIDDFADVQAAAKQWHFGTELDFGDQGSVLLYGISASSLSADDFVFV